MNGTVKFFNVGKGFGFIAGDDGKEYFVHKTGVGEGVNLNENDAVTFDVEEGDRGPKAVNVTKGDSGSSGSTESSQSEESPEGSENEESKE
jgi:cold shock protein